MPFRSFIHYAQSLLIAKFKNILGEISETFYYRMLDKCVLKYFFRYFIDFCHIENTLLFINKYFNILSGYIY